MELIKSLIHFRTKTIFHNTNSGKDKLLNKLEAFVIKNFDLPEEEILDSFFNTTKKQNNKSKVKNRLEHKLISDMWAGINNFDLINDMVNAKPFLSKMVTIGLIFNKISERTIAIEIFHRVVRYSRQYGFAYEVIPALQGLCSHYGYTEPNSKKFEEFNHDLLRLNEEAYHNNILNAHYAKVTHYLVQFGGKINTTQMEEIREAKNIMHTILEKYPTFLNTTLYFDVAYNYYRLTNDFQAAIHLCMKYYSDMDLNDKNQRLFHFTVTKNLAVLYFQLGKYTLAEEYFLVAKSIPTQINRYWIYITSTYFSNLMHQKRFNDALDLFIEVSSKRAMHKWPLYDQAWSIREAYLQWMIQAKKLEITDEQRSVLRPFKINKFLNEVPFYSKDKAGANISLIIVQILFLLLDGKLSKIVDRKDALAQYAHRYIKKNNYTRSQYFINLIINAINCGFNPVRTRAHTQRTYNLLLKQEIAHDENDPHIEIIPYEIQWEILLSILDGDKSFQDMV
jgi:tetratricopeptide (TPR) repeat protein